MSQRFIVEYNYSSNHIEGNTLTSPIGVDGGLWIGFNDKKDL